MINNVTLVGRLTRDVELTYTSNGTAVGRFTVAIDRRFQNQNGERETDFINCVMWRKAAENLAQYTRKGSLVGIEGRIQTRYYESPQGQRVYVTEVVADNFSLLERKNEGANELQPSNRVNGYPSQSKANTVPKQAKYSDPFVAAGDTVDISDEDLPF